MRRPSAIARDRALMRLRDLHPETYADFYRDELAAMEVEK